MGLQPQIPYSATACRKERGTKGESWRMGKFDNEDNYCCNSLKNNACICHNNLFWTAMKGNTIIFELNRPDAFLPGMIPKVNSFLI